MQIIEIIIFFLWSIEPIPEQCEFGTILTGDNGRPTCYFYHKGQHIYDFEMSKHYCEEFGGLLVTIKGPKDQENVFQMIQSGITASANSVMNLLEFRWIINGIVSWCLAALECLNYLYIFSIRMSGSELKITNGWRTTLTNPWMAHILIGSTANQVVNKVVSWC